MSVSVAREMLGKVFDSVYRRTAYGQDEVVFEQEGEIAYLVTHEQNCCEDVSIEDISGDLGDLTGAALLLAEKVTSQDESPSQHRPDSWLWPYVKFATIKGFVTIRFYGTSNGYYAEDADILDRQGKNLEYKADA